MTAPARMHAVSSTAPVLEDGELALYWDPRYGRYFYAGVMTPPTGQLYDFTGTAITLPTDTHTSSTVQLYRTDPYDRAPKAGRSILSRPGKDALHRRHNKERRVGWNLFSARRPAAPKGEKTEVNPGWRLANVFRCMVCPLLLVIVVVLAVILWLWLLQPRSESGAARPYRDDGSLTTDPGIVVPPPQRRAAAEETSEFNRPSTFGLPIDYSAEDSSALATNYILTTSDVRYLDAAVTASSATLSSGDLETRRIVCLVASPESTLEALKGNGSLWESHQHCDALVRCCYSLPVNLSTDDGLTGRGNPSADGSSTAARRSSRASTLLGVRVGDDVAFQSLLKNRRGARATFLLGVLEAAEMGKFSGVRLWVPWQEHVTPGFIRHLVSLARVAATELRGRKNQTFGFFLPQGLVSEQRGVLATELTKALDTAPYGLLLYPEFSAFWNTTGSTTAAWPTPEVVFARASVETRAMNCTTFVCYLPPPPAAVQVRLAERCDANKTQLISREAQLTFPTIGDVRRRLRDDNAWTSSARRYYTYACKDTWAILYQTTRQAWHFHEDMLVASPSFMCIGSFLEGLSDASDQIGSGSG